MGVLRVLSTRLDVTEIEVTEVDVTPSASSAIELGEVAAHE